ncbi:hypothetical protein KL918_003175 [Ogataea parapolymorpha]|uniref:candidapepsin n=2 Tax=Ogataea TaxID=461281 RepID=W1QAF4_OGAPD|nr:yapsin 1 [Ogataea parapolymorpha DL-1]AAQ06628.1 Yapsin1 [Ogataea angusta]ESW97796.1 yapsin 1 [Ogataea parapolymorpha DL-1]KAG7866980.1 hypothetical protein KL918_003175 [Ogataea parapolymorpha]KAG7872344.1 hypothetical protein KL916_003079 [Ogataea parapolymorpha]
MKVATLFFLASSVCVLGDPQFVKLEASVLRGSTYKDSQKGAKPFMLEKRADDGSVTMELQNAQSFYQVEIEIGSDKQKVGVLIDTGSSDLWVMNSNNSYCSSSSTKKLKRDGPADALQKGRDLSDLYNFNSPNEDNNAKGFLGGWGDLTTVETATQDETQTALAAQATVDCSLYGTFNPSTSNSFHNNGTTFEISYADRTFARGTWGYDDVTFNGVTVNDLSLAVADETDSSTGVFGIGLRELETTYSGGGPQHYIYDNLPFKMVDQGLINRAAYSVYLNSTESSTASILFGAVDQSKYTGSLGLLPIINTAASYGYQKPLRLQITLSAITVSDSRGQQASIGSGAAAALLDTGTTLTYAPSEIVEKLAETLGFDYSSSVGAYVARCRDVDSYAVNFDFQGKVIEAPLSSFLIALQTNSGEVSSYCALGIFSSGDESFTLGDTFLRNAYFVADLEGYQIAIANVNLNPGAEQIEVISGNSIPSASSVSDYSNTWGASATALDTDRPTTLGSVTAVGDERVTSTKKVSSVKTSTSSGSGSTSESSTSSSHSSNGPRTVGFSLCAVLCAFLISILVVC